MRFEDISRKESVLKALKGLLNEADYFLFETTHNKQVFNQIYEHKLSACEGIGKKTMSDLKQWLGGVNFKERSARASLTRTL
jgi:excinuclease UvrABC nuclease subunit